MPSVELYYSPAGRVDDLAGEGNNCFMNPKSLLTIYNVRYSLSTRSRQIETFIFSHLPALHSTLLGRYRIASARCAGPMSGAPARSAMVRTSLSTRWNARAER